MSDFEGREIEVEIDVEDEGQVEETDPDSPYHLSGGVLSFSKRKEVVETLMQEAENAIAEWSEDREDWKKWRRQYKGKPKHKVKNYPMPNSSNVPVPLMRSITNTLYGKLVEMFEAHDPFWEAVNDRKNDEAEQKKMEVLTKYMNMIFESEQDLDGRNRNETLLREAALMGLCVLKVPYTVDEWKYKKNDAENTEITTTAHNGPEFIVIPREDVLYRKSFDNIATMPWFCHVLHFNYTDLMRSQDIYENIDKIKNKGRPMNDFQWESVMVDGYEDEIMGSGDTPMMSMWDIGEFHVWVDADDDGSLEDVKITIDLQTHTVLREEYNDLGMRPYVPFIFLSDSFKLAGEGTGESTTYQDEEATAMNNLKNDNAKIVNSRVIITRRNSSTLGAREKLFPGKIIFADNPKEDVQSFQMGEIYPSASQAINESVMWAQRATGMSDAMAGFADTVAKSGDTFRGQNQRLQQGQGIFTSISQGLVRAFSKTARVVLYQLIQHREEVIEKETDIGRLTSDEIDTLNEVLNIPLNKLPVQVNFRVKTTDVEDTFESKRQNYLTLSQLFAQFAQQTMPLAQQVLGPQGQQMAQQAPELYQYMASILNGSTKLMGEIFKFFNEDDVDKYVPQNKKMDAMLEIMKSLQGDVAEQMLNRFEQQKAITEGNATVDEAMMGTEVDQQVQPNQQEEPNEDISGGMVPPMS